MGLKATGSYPTGQRRRERIVDEATRLFGEQGYHATPLNAVAEAVGISESGLAHHFRSKSQLLQAVAERRLSETAAWWEALPSADSPIAVLDEMVAATRRFTEQPGLIELFVLSLAEAADPSSPAHARMSQRYESIVGQLADRFRRAAEAGEIRDDLDPDLIARESIAVSDGLQLQWVLSDGKTDIVSGIALYSAALRDRLRPR